MYSNKLNRYDWLVIICLLSTLCLIAVWGITQSVSTAALFTFLEVIGLMMVLWVAASMLDQLPARREQFSPPLQLSEWTGVIGGAFLAFYAYIGFEDMVKVAEEVKQPQKNMPRAILLCVVLSTLLYSLVALVAISVLPPEQLTLMLVLQFIGALTGGPLSAVIWAMYADTADYGTVLIQRETTRIG